MKIENWFTGVVEGIDDPRGMGRVQVRCFDYHTGDHEELPSEDLLWMHVYLPADSSFINGVGRGSFGLEPNSWVFGFFRDKDLQDGVVLAGIPGGVSSQATSSFNLDSNYGWGDPAGGVGPQLGNLPADIDSFLGSRAFGSGSSSYLGGMTSYVNGPLGSIHSTGGNPAVPLPPDFVPGGDIEALVSIAEGQLGASDNGNNTGAALTYLKSVGINFAASWCAAFMSWCVENSGIISDPAMLPKTAGAYAFRDVWAKKKIIRDSRIIISRGSPNKIFRGDLLIFSWSHIGMAVETAEGKRDGIFRVRTIEGNTGDPEKRKIGDVVAYKNRRLSDVSTALTWNLTGAEIVPPTPTV